MTDPAPRKTPTSLLKLDGDRGEGGGQILRSALGMALLTGRPFQLSRIRARRNQPGLRPQHLTAVQAAATLTSARLTGATVGSCSLTFEPREFVPRDLKITIGTAGSTALILHALAPPLALRASTSIHLKITGGTFNESAPSYPYLQETWLPLLRQAGYPISLTSPRAGFYPPGGGCLEAWIEPARPEPIHLDDRGPLLRIRGFAGVAQLPLAIAERMSVRTQQLLAQRNLSAELEHVEWLSTSPGAAIVLISEHASAPPATFLAVGRRGHPAEAVASEAVAALLAHEDAGAGALDPHAADQMILPLAFATGPSSFTVSEVTEHLRTNLGTVSVFIDRTIELVEIPGAAAQVVFR